MNSADDRSNPAGAGRRGKLPPPDAYVIEPEVRTGVQYALVAAVDDTALSAAVDRGSLISTIVVEWGYDVPRERQDAFTQWLSRFEAAFAAASPTGVRYRGTYTIVFGSEKTAGFFRTLWGFANAGALGLLGARSGVGEADPKSKEFARLMKEFDQFRDRSPGANWSQSMMQASVLGGRY